MSSPLSTTIDIRGIELCDQQPTFFARIDALRAGEALAVIGDHDLTALRNQLELRSPGQFHWTPLVSGPDAWHVQISKAAAVLSVLSSDSCCSGGGCGG